MTRFQNHPAFTAPPQDLPGDLAVIACHFNPCGYARPVENLGRFLDGMASARAPLFMAELTFAGGQEPVLPEDSPRVLQLRLPACQDSGLLWQKEAMLNALAARLPARFRKVAWVDADILFSDPGWCSAASRLLEEDDTPIIQLFTRAHLTDKSGRIVRMKLSVGHATARRHPAAADWSMFHPGFAWAARREFFSEEVGGLYPCIVGAGDTVTALGAIGRLSRAHPHCAGFSSAHYAHARAYAAHLTAWTGGRLRALRGDITHLWHGSREDRHYAAKQHWIRDLDPEHDLCADPASGLLSWTPAALTDKPEMVQSVSNYFALRREDGEPPPKRI